jgi:catechol 2,3-dioxygenase
MPVITSAATIHPDTEMGMVTLKVADLRRSLVFYTEIIGMRILAQEAQSATLGVAARPIVRIEAIPNAQQPPRNSTGLYHAAILLPDRKSLAIKIAQIASAKYPLGGYADHLVSEAFYLDDPDGNGLEIYRDRPRNEWPRIEGAIQMASDPIDLDEFFSLVPEKLPADFALPIGTTLGHMHLRIGDIPTALKFYRDVMGFDLITTMPSALFLSAGGYHHHLGMNIWESRNGQAAPESAVGLREFSVWLPDIIERDRLVAQIKAAGVTVARDDDSFVVSDPWQNRISLTVRQ